MSTLDELIQIVGKERVSIDEAVLYTYSRDCSFGVGKPDYVVQPISTKEVAAVVTLAAKHKIPVVPRGAGSGTSGGSVPVTGGIVIDLCRLDKKIEIEVANLCVTVDAGVIEGKLNKELAKLGFFFPPDPASANFCTIGGLIANGAGGSGGLKYGITKHHVLDLEVVLANGSVIHTGSKVAKSRVGYDLNSLFVGSEGTLGIITRATLKILPLPQANSTVVAYFDDLVKAGSVIPQLLSKKIIPGACEIMDKFAINCVNAVVPVFRQCEAVLLFRLDGSEETAKKEAATVVSVCQEAGAIEVKAAAGKEAEQLWLGRHSMASALTNLGKPPILCMPYTADDFGVPPSRIPEIMQKIKSIVEGKKVINITAAHIGDGNLHGGIAIDLNNEAEATEAKEMAAAIFNAALELEGTIACEHGVGIAKISWLKKEKKDSFPVMILVKKALDPDNIMNPGKMFEQGDLC